MSDDSAALKHHFNRKAATRLAKQIRAVDPEFASRRFVSLAAANLEQQEFQQRIVALSDALAATLPGDVPAALETLTRSLPEMDTEGTAVMDGYLQWPLGQFIADHALEHPDEAMSAMVELTQRFSSEFAVRPFVERYPDRIFEELHALTSHPSHHVRRWCSEGTRPRLPWGKKLHFLCEDPSPILPILEELKDDPSEYVRRSVANNLNDIVKDHPSLVLRICRRWAKKASADRKWVIKHALRTLIKRGDDEALKILGFGEASVDDVRLTCSPKSLRIGETVSFRLRTTSRTAQMLLVDYGIHFVRQNGSANRKVFKWKMVEAEPNQILDLAKTMTVAQRSTRRLYPGHHRVDVQINGQVLASTSFVLRE